MKGLRQQSRENNCVCVFVALTTVKHSEESRKENNFNLGLKSDTFDKQPSRSSTKEMASKKKD